MMLIRDNASFSSYLEEQVFYVRGEIFWEVQNLCSTSTSVEWHEWSSSRFASMVDVVSPVGGNVNVRQNQDWVVVVILHMRVRYLIQYEMSGTLQYTFKLKPLILIKCETYFSPCWEVNTMYFVPNMTYF